MQSATKAIGALLIAVCIIGGTVGILIGSIFVMMWGDWHMLVGSAGIVTAGTLFGKWIDFGDAEIKDQSSPVR